MSHSGSKGRPLIRDRKVYFLGAGFSKAFGLPLTDELLTELRDLAKRPEGHFLNKNANKQSFNERLDSVIQAIYPDGRINGYQPSAVDFFSTVSTFVNLTKKSSTPEDSGSLPNSSFPGGNPSDYLKTLKMGISKILASKTESFINGNTIGKEVKDIVKPGNVIITSNWDLLVEYIAKEQNISLTRRYPPRNDHRDKSLTLLKLHGSVDWTTFGDVRAGNNTKPNILRKLETKSQGYTDRSYPLPTQPNTDDVFRISWPKDSAWQSIEAATHVPYILTMATGKSDDLGPLQDIWSDAYKAIGSAKDFHIVGYSMPDDDAEIRTLMRAGVIRGDLDGSKLKVHVNNPSPDVHDRIRRYIHSPIDSNYSGVRLS